jgi:hypothetical protein
VDGSLKLVDGSAGCGMVQMGKLSSRHAAFCPGALKLLKPNYVLVVKDWS